MRKRGERCEVGKEERERSKVVNGS